MKTTIAVLLFGLSRVLAGEPDMGGAEQKAIRSLLDQRKFQEALDTAKALNKRVPDNVAAYEYIADAQLGLGNVEEAEKAAQWMLDLKLGKVTPSGSRVVARIRKHYKDYDGAVEILLAGYKRLSPEDAALRVPMLEDIAEMYKLAGKTEFSAKILDQARKLSAAAAHSEGSAK